MRRKHMDFKNTTSHPPSTQGIEREIQYGFISASVFAMFLNILVAAILLHFSKLLRRRSNKFLLNHLISNITVASMNLAFALFVLITSSSENTFRVGKPPPIKITMMLALVMMLSILSMILLSIDRLLTVAFTFRYFNVVKSKHVHAAIATPWLLSTLYFAAIMAVYKKKIAIIKTVVYFSFHVIALLGMLTLTVSNTIIFQQARKQLVAISKTSVTRCDNAKQKEQDLKNRECRIALINIGIVVKFIVCWLPTVINIIVHHRKRKMIAKWLEIFAIGLVLFNLIMDPIIYVFLSRDVRIQIHKLVRRNIESTSSTNMTATSDQPVRSDLRREDVGTAHC